MRVAMTARGLILATTTAGLGVVVAGAAQAADVSLATVALLGAAVVLTELFQVSNDESSGDPDDAHHFSFSSAVHLAAVAALTITYSLVNSVLVSSVVALTSNRSPWAEIRDGVRAELPPRAAESGLGIAAAFCALTQPWAVVPLLPLGYAVYQAHARLMSPG